MYVNQNGINETRNEANIMFVDMNSFFPSCEQQVNFWLRHRPVGVCVYTGKQGAVIALSTEAKKMGIKPARLDQIMPHHPEFVPLETNPARYREFHQKIIRVLGEFCDDVIPKSIDEAVLNFSTYRMIHTDLMKVAKDIKKRIKSDVGDWFTCSIGIAPNAFLAKLASNVVKPDGLTLISPENIDGVLDKLSLTDLPGISTQMSKRLMMGGIHSPIDLRYSSPDKLRKACKSIIGEYWFYRLNFKEVDIATDDYKSMQAMRQISKDQRKNLATLYDILRELCLQLEKRMMKHDLKAHTLGFSCNYEDGTPYTDFVHTESTLQGAIEMQQVILDRICRREQEISNGKIINQDITRMCVWVTDFSASDYVQFALFGNSLRQDKLRQVVYSIKDQFGFEKIQLAGELTDTPVMKDVIGFGSIKDMLPAREKPKPANKTPKTELVVVPDIDFLNYLDQ
ncbi:MAG: DNA polymerase IV [Bacteroidetes bacterium]|nr:DNA polymerase IV [Bacteroidota bacterium]